MTRTRRAVRVLDGGRKPVGDHRRHEPTGRQPCDRLQIEGAPEAIGQSMAPRHAWLVAGSEDGLATTDEDHMAKIDGDRVIARTCPSGSVSRRRADPHRSRTAPNDMAHPRPRAIRHYALPNHYLEA
jgi:hypothetical protein